MRYTEVQNRAIQQLHSEFGIHADGIYCQITGQLIGIVGMEVMLDIFQSMPQDMDAESICDDLRIRVLASMRPSPAWNYIRPNTLALKVKSDPVGLLAYLLNRAQETILPRDERPDLPTQMTRLQAKIATYVAVEAAAIPSATIEAIMLVLLELDAKFSLKNLAIPFNLQQLILTSPSDILIMLAKWRDKLVDAEIKRQKAQADSDRSFIKGNGAAKMAYVQELFRQTPPSERKTIDLKKIAVRQEIGDIFDELEVALRKPGTSGPTTMAKPAAVYKAEAEARIYKPTPVTGGFKFKSLKLGGAK